MPWIKKEETIDCFIRAFRVLGYRECSSSIPERLFEKVALYAIGSSPKHMARQLPDGSWSSKIGSGEDITHYTLDAVESFGPAPFYGEYGVPVLFMKRHIVIALIVRMIQRALESLWHLLGLLPCLKRP
jgi:hypothetical protein